MSLIKRLKPKALAIGVGVQVLGSLLSGFMLGFFLSFTHVPPEEMVAYMKTDWILFVSILMSIITVIFAGWATGQFVLRSKILNAGVVAAICLAIGLPFLAAYPRWYGITLIILAIPAGMLGGYLAEKWKS